jgi:hypothetical protein
MMRLLSEVGTAVANPPSAKPCRPGGTALDTKNSDRQLLQLARMVSKRTIRAAVASQYRYQP